MVSADNLNLDCLEIIFAYLYGNDLVSVSLVSRSFLAGVIPRLYRSLVFTLNQAKRYPAILSPFASVLRHPTLATHVRHIDIRTVPSSRSILKPEFMRDCSRVIDLCDNLVSFTCTPPVLQCFLLDLQDKPSLQHIRFNGNMTRDQAELFVKIQGLKSITLDAGSTHAVDVLPRWTTALKTTLTELTLYCIQDLNEPILENAIVHLPRLNGLHVIKCAKIDHNVILRLTSFTPDLRSLSFTTWDSPRPMATDSVLNGIAAPLHRLSHLTIDSHCTVSPPTTPDIWTSFIQQTRLWAAPLRSLTLKVTEKLVVSESFIADLVRAHKATLTHIALLNCTLAVHSTQHLCMRCKGLERFAVCIPAKDRDIAAFAVALSHSTSLRALSDVSDPHSSHGTRVNISKSEIRTLFERVPSLRRVITDERVWMAEERKDGIVRLELKRKTAPPIHWFMPPSQTQQS